MGWLAPGTHRLQREIGECKIETEHASVSKIANGVTTDCFLLTSLALSAVHETRLFSGSVTWQFHGQVSAEEKAEL